MGLYVHALSRLPLGTERDYYLYVLDYGWHEPLAAAVHQNFRHMSDLAAKNKAIVIAGTDSRAFADEVLSVHFEDEQFSWSNINGENGEDVLPAIMISTVHPNAFLEQNRGYRPSISSKGGADDKLILIPLRGVCKETSDVTSLIEKIFRDIADKKALTEFAIAKEINAGSGRALSDAFILKPSIYGVGVDIKELVGRFRRKKA